jgi:hypothetical protein
VHARGCAGQCSQAQCRTEGVGLASGHRWSSGAAGLRRRLPRADAPARLPAARSAPRADPHGAPAATDPASWPRRQRSKGASTRATSPSRPNRGELPVAGCGDGAWPPPSPAVGLSGRNGTRKERLRRPSDRLRRLLTEPAPPGFRRLSGEGGGVVSEPRDRRGRSRASERPNVISEAYNRRRGQSGSPLLRRANFQSRYAAIRRIRDLPTGCQLSRSVSG